MQYCLTFYAVPSPIVSVRRSGQGAGIQCEGRHPVLRTPLLQEVLLNVLCKLKEKKNLKSSTTFYLEKIPLFLFLLQSTLGFHSIAI